ncbi:MAG: PEP-CTERM sorting domain-containing protein [Parahaliea sp.]
MNYRQRAVSSLAVTVAAFSLGAQALPITTDIISVVDESGSMSGEHAWLSTMMTDLDAALGLAAGSDPLSARYGLVGFGGNNPHYSGHQHDVGGVGSQYGTVAEFTTATAALVIDGGTEDGYSGITTAMGYGKQPGAVRNLILVTDEDRDDIGGGETYDSMFRALSGDQALLNAVLDISVNCNGSSASILGVDSKGMGYIADGVGGFTTCGAALVTSGEGSSIADYANLAFATGGAAWDLKQLRAGGLTATSFTAAFINVKVQETIGQSPTDLPVPGSLALLGLGLAGLGLAGRRQKKAA